MANISYLPPRFLPPSADFPTLIWFVDVDQVSINNELEHTSLKRKGLPLEGKNICGYT